VIGWFDVLLGRAHFYRVNIHGHGILVADSCALVPDADSSEPIIGFYALRVVAAHDAETAVIVATSMVEETWRQPHFASINVGAPPVLEVEDVGKVSLWEGLWQKNSGHAFYESDPSAS
jgi:hypothetical protein